MATPPRAAEVLPTAGRRRAHRDERQRYAQGPLELELLDGAQDNSVREATSGFCESCRYYQDTETFASIDDILVHWHVL